MLFTKYIFDSVAGSTNDFVKFPDTENAFVSTLIMTDVLLEWANDTR